MIETHLRHCVYDPDPRGNDRYYVRKPGFKKVRIRETFKDEKGNVTEAFMKAYFAALASLTDTAPAPKKEPLREHTFEWLVNRYYQSAQFQKLGPTTQREKRSILNRYCASGKPPAGSRQYKGMKREDVERSQAKRHDTPGAADALVKVLRALFNWAMKQKPPLISHNPAVGISKINISDGFHTWTEDEVASYRAHHPLGTNARLALEIMLNIGARISDAVVVGPPHRTGNVLSFTAQKNRAKKPTRIDVKIYRELDQALAATETGKFTFLVTEYGLPFSKNGLSGNMREWCDAAGLPHCSSHGLRKAAAVEHAENGSTAMEMCAVFGWSKLETAEIYIRAAGKKIMSMNAADKVEHGRRMRNVSLLGSQSLDETNHSKNEGKSNAKDEDGTPNGRS